MSDAMTDLRAETFERQYRQACQDHATAMAEIVRLRAVMQEVSDEMETECMRDGGLYWLPASSHRVDDWNGKLKCAVEQGADK